MTNIRAIELQRGDELLGEHAGMITDVLSTDARDGMMHVLVHRELPHLWKFVWVHIPARQLVDAVIATEVVR